jgi:GNAT superfamily N-acetyltransferase
MKIGPISPASSKAEADQRAAGAWSGDRRLRQPNNAMAQAAGLRCNPRSRPACRSAFSAYRDGAPIAWCSIAPRDTYRHLGGLDDFETPERVWALACFFIKREYRGHGISKKLLLAAVDHAARNGATVVEAYPVDPDSPSYRFMGFVETFSEAGFEKVGRAGRRRHVMRFPVLR